jgi:hypothetical protein
VTNEPTEPTELTNVQRHARRTDYDGVGDGELAEDTRRCRGQRGSD